MISGEDSSINRGGLPGLIKIFHKHFYKIGHRQDRRTGEVIIKELLLVLTTVFSLQRTQNQLQMVH